MFTFIARSRSCRSVSCCCCRRVAIWPLVIARTLAGRPASDAVDHTQSANQSRANFKLILSSRYSATAPSLALSLALGSLAPCYFSIGCIWSIWSISCCCCPRLFPQIYLQSNLQSRSPDNWLLQTQRTRDLQSNPIRGGFGVHGEIWAPHLNTSIRLPRDPPTHTRPRTDRSRLWPSIPYAVAPLARSVGLWLCGSVGISPSQTGVSVSS